MTVRYLVTLLLLNSYAAAAVGGLLISGVVDGTNMGGNPKAIEIYAMIDIAHLSDFSIVRDTNGAGPFDTALALPDVALNAGDFFYIAGNMDSASALAGFGFTVGVTNSIANMNGDDIFGIGTGVSRLTNVVDSFGQVGQGASNFYQDSIAIRNASSSTGVVGGLFDATNFLISSYSDAALQGTNGFGTFAPTAVPEPSSLYCLSLVGIGLLVRRTCNRLTSEN